ncbi:hypothetical protein B0H11DRAFT_1908432 [Mycena galericulata]|nr:hypothetical protein B0H11DRAFT_1908432 [Mycena galericulata]
MRCGEPFGIDPGENGHVQIQTFDEDGGCVFQLTVLGEGGEWGLGMNRKIQSFTTDDKLREERGSSSRLRRTWHWKFGSIRVLIDPNQPIKPAAASEIDEDLNRCKWVSELSQKKRNNYQTSIKSSGGVEPPFFREDLHFDNTDRE